MRLPAQARYRGIHPTSLTGTIAISSGFDKKHQTTHNSENPTTCGAQVHRAIKRLVTADCVAAYGGPLMAITARCLMRLFVTGSV